MLQEGAIVYVCGNASTMGKSLDMIIDTILKQVRDDLLANFNGFATYQPSCREFLP